MTFVVSKEQAAVISHGRDRSYEWIEMPVGPRPLPRWVRGMHVDWMLEYENSPRITLKTNDDLRHWDNKRFEHQGGRFMARHSDGRAEVYYHHGAVRMVTLERHVRTGRHEFHKEPYEALATTQQQGFGGDHIPIVMGGKGDWRGKTIVLRGPWHGLEPPGYVEVAYVNTAEPWLRKIITHRRGGGWRRTGGRGGLYLREELFVAIVARFLPHCRLARITHDKYSTIDLVHPSWPKPKQWLAREERKLAVTP